VLQVLRFDEAAKHDVAGVAHRRSTRPKDDIVQSRTLDDRFHVSAEMDVGIGIHDVLAKLYPFFEMSYFDFSALCDGQLVQRYAKSVELVPVLDVLADMGLHTTPFIGSQYCGVEGSNNFVEWCIRCADVEGRHPNRLAVTSADVELCNFQARQPRNVDFGWFVVAVPIIIVLVLVLVLIRFMIVGLLVVIVIVNVITVVITGHHCGCG